MIEPGALTAALNWYRAIEPRSLADVGPITVPTLYVWSTEDIALGRAGGRGDGAVGVGALPLRGARGREPLDPRDGADDLTAPARAPGGASLTRRSVGGAAG